MTLKAVKLLILSFSLIISPWCLSTPEIMNLGRSSFHQLPGWEKDNHGEAIATLQRSCVDIVAQVPSNPVLQKWQVLCASALQVDKNNARAARLFFEKKFIPYAVSVNSDYNGMFTGYYMPLLHARLKPNKEFNVPIHALPGDLVKVDLGKFRPELKGKNIVGQAVDNTLIPYPDRQTIISGKMSNSRILAWSNSVIDVFFAQIQGSAVVELPNKFRFVIGYAGDNGRTYTPIGKVLVASNEIRKEAISMQSIKTWLLQHPKKVQRLLNTNSSYVFFKVLKNNQPLGTERIALTPARSLAVDNRYIQFGTPIWLDTEIPDSTMAHTRRSFRQLLIAQDTGGAIKGAIRGDIYWGEGEDAAYIAGHMRSRGRYWILLPK